MFHLPFPGRDDAVLFSMPVEGVSRWLQLPILVVVLAVIGWVVYRLYRLERSYVPGHWSRVLLACRLALVAVVFAIATLQPQVRHVSRETIPSHVLIAIDRSQSMSITDPQRDPVEKIELARTLKLADDATLEQWLTQLRQLNPPDDAAYRKVIDRVDAMSRYECVQRALDPRGLALLEALGSRHRLELVGFDQRLLPLAGISDSLRSSEASETNLTLPLKQGLERREALKEGLVGIVVLSDGQHNLGGPPGEWARQLGGGEGKPAVPVHTIVCGARVAPADLSIVSARAVPPVVFKHGSAHIELRLQANNLPAGRFRITVQYPDADDLRTRPPIVEFIDYDGATPPPARTIPVKMDRASVEKLKVTVDALDQTGQPVPERFRDNNSRYVVINVAPDKARVLLIDGEARWEQHYLQTALNRDETMTARCVVFDQPRLDLVKENDLVSLGLPELMLPSADELASQDCIILGDVSPGQLSLDDRKRLERYVAERGGTLVILAGKRSMPMQYLDASDPLAKLLPISRPHVVDRKDGFQVALTGDGLQTSFMRLENDAWTSEERWRQMPPHYWAITGTARAGAIVLAQAPAAKRMKADSEREEALIVRHNYGFGRVIYVGLDSTWRWRYKQGDKYHHRFWSQLIRWAASDRALVAGNDFARFGVREAVYPGDREIELLVRLGDQARQTPANAAVSARLFRKKGPGIADEAVGRLTLKPHPEIPGQFETVQSPLPPGDYEMEVSIPGIDDKLVDPAGRPLRAQFQVLPTETGEMLNLAANWVQMKELADKSGGISVALEKANDVIDKLKARTASREVTVDTRLATSWWLLLPLIGLLSIEWLIRKWVGLT